MFIPMAVKIAKNDTLTALQRALFAEVGDSLKQPQPNVVIISSGKRSVKLPLFLAISLITDFYTGYMMCLFVALYTFYVVFSKDIPLERGESLN